MVRAATYLLTVALSFGAGAAVSSHPSGTDPNASLTKAQAGNAAFRDGLYLGKLSARQGEIPHISSGRWSSYADRTAFAQGYRAGYQSATE
jgi:hypothetical protein